MNFQTIEVAHNSHGWENGIQKNVPWIPFLIDRTPLQRQQTSLFISIQPDFLSQ